MSGRMADVTDGGGILEWVTKRDPRRKQGRLTTTTTDMTGMTGSRTGRTDVPKIKTDLLSSPPLSTFRKRKNDKTNAPPKVTTIAVDKEVAMEMTHISPSVVEISRVDPSSNTGLRVKTLHNAKGRLLEELTYERALQMIEEDYHRRLIIWDDAIPIHSTLLYHNLKRSNVYVATAADTLMTQGERETLMWSISKLFDHVPDMDAQALITRCHMLMKIWQEQGACPLDPCAAIFEKYLPEIWPQAVSSLSPEKLQQIQGAYHNMCNCFKMLMTRIVDGDPAQRTMMETTTTPHRTGKKSGRQNWGREKLLLKSAYVASVPLDTVYTGCMVAFMITAATVEVLMYIGGAGLLNLKNHAYNKLHTQKIPRGPVMPLWTGLREVVTDAYGLTRMVTKKIRRVDAKETEFKRAKLDRSKR